MENLNNENELSEKSEISTKPQSEKILITQTNDIKNKLGENKKKKRHKKKKSPKQTKKEELTEEQINKFRLQDKTISSSFISYYKNLLGFDDSEFSSFLKISVEDLPIIFRINKIYTYSESLEEEISEFFHKNYDHYNKRLTRPKLNFLDNIYQLSYLDKKDKIDSELKQILFT